MRPMERVAREFGLLVRSLKGLHAETAAAGTGTRLEMPAAAVLTVLEERGPLRSSSLADVLHLDLSSVSRQVSALERDGLLSRRRDPDDSRAALLELTPTGRTALGHLRTARVTHLQRLLPDWTDTELADFADVLHRFRTDLSRGQSRQQPALATARTPLANATDHTPALAGQERP